MQDSTWGASNPSAKSCTGVGWVGLNLHRFAGALSHEHAEPLATEFGRLSAGVVDSDVAIEMGCYHGNTLHFVL
jgi:hypothetical protein